MMYPVVVPIHSGGGSIKPFESTLEMVACGSLFLFLTVAVIGGAVFLFKELDSIIAKVFVFICSTLLVVFLWCLFVMFC